MNLILIQQRQDWVWERNIQQQGYFINNLLQTHTICILSNKLKVGFHAIWLCCLHCLANSPLPFSLEMGRMQTSNTWPLLVPSNWFQLVLVPVICLGHNAGNQDKSSFRQTLQLLGAKLNQRMRKKKSHLPSSFTPPCSDEIVGKNAAGVFSFQSFHKGLWFSQAKALNISVSQWKLNHLFHPPPPPLRAPYFQNQQQFFSFQALIQWI